jgi:hypothetical protein
LPASQLRAAGTSEAISTHPWRVDRENVVGASE